MNSMKFARGRGSRGSKPATVAEDAVRDQVVGRDVTATIATRRVTSGHRNLVLPRCPAAPFPLAATKI